jgi:hypothetical protein
MPELQRRTFEVMNAAYPGSMRTSTTPRWLDRPGREECGRVWQAIQLIYGRLTDGMELPDVMPARERRTLDGLMERPGERPRVVEFDESQHFNEFRALTLRLYPPATSVAFPLDTWLSASQRGRTIMGGGWAAPKPPLFPMAGGRNRQRAFRDALADLLPRENDLAPTLRIADFEVKPWIWDKTAASRMRLLVDERLAAASASVEAVSDG